MQTAPASSRHEVAHLTRESYPQSSRRFSIELGALAGDNSSLLFCSVRSQAFPKSEPTEYR